MNEFIECLLNTTGIVLNILPASSSLILITITWAMGGISLFKVRNSVREASLGGHSASKY